MTKYIYVGTDVVAQHTGEERLWLATDRLGSPRASIDPHGHVQSRHNYGAFGTATSGQSTPANNPGYAGHRSIAGTGIVDMAARDYDPHLGRMLSADTVIPDASNPITLNPYAYAYNNPITYTDPSGHVSVDPTQTPVAFSDNTWADFCRTAQAYARIGEQAFNRVAADTLQRDMLRIQTLWDVEKAQVVGQAGSKPSAAELHARRGGFTLLGTGDPHPDSSTTEPQAEDVEVRAAAAVTPSAQTPKTTPSGEVEPIVDNGYIEAAWVDPPQSTQSSVVSQSVVSPPLEPDIFFWGSFTIPGQRLGPISMPYEVVGVAGLAMNEGPYLGLIRAIGLQGGHGAHVAGFYGEEKTWQWALGKEGSTAHRSSIFLGDVAAGPVVVGAWAQQLSSARSGVIGGWANDWVGFGIGFNFDYLRSIPNFMRSMVHSPLIILPFGVR